MVLLSAALLALSVHILPAIAVAIAIPQTSQCVSECASLQSDLNTCNVTSADLNAGLTAAQAQCLCKASGFAAAAATCLTCLGTPTTQAEMESSCAGGSSSQSASSVVASKTASSSRSAVSATGASKTVSSAETATRTTSSSSQSASLTPSQSACAKTQQCTSAADNLNTCQINTPLNSLTDSDWKCLCNQSGFLDNLIACEKCLGANTTTGSTICDAYVSSTLASSTGAQTSTSTSGATIAATATDTATGTATSAAKTSPTTLSLGTATKGGAAENSIPGVAVPILVAAFVYQLVWGF